MNSVMSPRSKVPKSRIPVLVKNQSRIPVPVYHKSSNVNGFKKKDLKKPVFKAPLPNSTKFTRSSYLQKQSSSQLVRSVKVQNDKCIRSVKSNQNEQSSLKNNNSHSNINKKDKSLQLRNSVKLVSDKEKDINKRDNTKEKGFKSTDIMLKSKIINDSSERKVASLKTNAQTMKNKTGELSTLKTAIECCDSRKKLIPQKCETEKENKAYLKPSWFTAQKDIMFEINEKNRNMILKEHAPSPGVGNKMSGFRLSSLQSQRPSLYQPMEIPADPHKEALRAIEKACLSAKREQRHSKLEKPLKLFSPFKDRNSFYTPCADPKQEVMESLRKLKLKQKQQLLQKSTKKVTFNLNVIECTLKSDSDTTPELYQEGKLSQIQEKSEENTPNFTDQDKASIQSYDFKKTDEVSQDNREIKVAEVHDKCEKGFCTPFEKSIPSTEKNIKPDAVLREVQCKAITSPLLLLLADKMSTKHERTTNQQIFEQTLMNKENINVSKTATVYTPRPISLFSQSKLKDSCSPEYLVKGMSEMLLKEAPICTPLVWKNVAKNSLLSPDMETNLSPVRLKLDFTEKDTPRKEISKFYSSLKCKKIKTVQAKLDELADQECHEWLSSEIIPVVCGRYVTNPVAAILDEGDEMHFIPIKF